MRRAKRFVVPKCGSRSCPNGLAIARPGCLQVKLAKWTGNCQAKLPKWTGNCQAKLTEWTGNCQAKLPQWTGNCQAKLTEWTGNCQAKLAKWTGNRQAKLTEWTGNCQAKLAKWTGNHQAKLTEWTGNCQAKLTEWTGNCQAKLPKWTGNCQAKLTEWTGNCQAKLAKWTGNCQAKLAEWTGNCQAKLPKCCVQFVKLGVGEGFCFRLAQYMDQNRARVEIFLYLHPTCSVLCRQISSCQLLFLRFAQVGVRCPSVRILRSFLWRTPAQNVQFPTMGTDFWMNNSFYATTKEVCCSKMWRPKRYPYILCRFEAAPDPERCGCWWTLCLVTVWQFLIISHSINEWRRRAKNRQDSLDEIAKSFSDAVILVALLTHLFTCGIDAESCSFGSSLCLILDRMCR